MTAVGMNQPAEPCCERHRAVMCTVSSSGITLMYTGGRRSLPRCWRLPGALIDMLVTGRGQLGANGLLQANSRNRQGEYYICGGVGGARATHGAWRCAPRRGCSGLQQSYKLLSLKTKAEVLRRKRASQGTACGNGTEGQPVAQVAAVAPSWWGLAQPATASQRAAPV